MVDCYVYVLADSTGIRYIGVSSNPEQRFKNHVYEAKNKNGKSYNLRKSNWLRSIDFNFKSRLVYKGTEEECYDVEVKLILMAIQKGKNIVNLTTGGDRPPRITELNNFEEIREKIKQKAIGRAISDSTRKKMSDSKKGKPIKWIGDMSGIKNPRSRPVIQMDKNNNVMFIWPCAKDAVNFLGLSKTSVTSVCCGNQKTAGGFKFVYF